MSLSRNKMATKIYRTAVLGSNTGEATPVQCALRLFDLTCEEVCVLLETVDLSGTTESVDLGPTAITTYDIQGGGRLFPPVSRQMVTEAMKGVELLVAMVSSNQINWIYWEVFECLIEDNLMDGCMLVLKLVDDLSPGAEPQATVTADNASQNCGLIGEKWIGSAHVIAGPSLGGSGLSRGIADLRAKLHAAAPTASIKRPAKETVTARKVVLKAGRAFVRWLKR